ncbi:MAG TPA: glycosyltransferase family 4 protein [Candidatus Methanoperedens sp.]
MRIGICAVQVPFIKGGAENHTLGLYEELIKRGYEVEYINIPFKWYPPGEIVKHALIWRMIDLTESNGEKIDLLICTKFPSYVVKHPNKVVWLLHQYRQAYDLFDTKYGNLNSSEGKIIRELIARMDNKTLTECNKIYTNSKNVASRLEKYNGINGIPLYHPPKNAERFYCGETGDYFIYPSRIESIKRQYLLIEAMQHTKTAAKIIIIGKGPQENELKLLAKNLNVTEKVQFRGYASDDELVNLYANSMGVVFIPIDEDYGYITLEAFLSGKPVITAFDSGGPLEFVEDSKNGYILNPGASEIAQKIDYLFNNKDLAKKMGLEGYKKIKNMNISWDNVIRQLVG